MELKILCWTLDLEIVRLRSYLGPSLLQFRSLDVPWSMVLVTKVVVNQVGPKVTVGLRIRP